MKTSNASQRVRPHPRAKRTPARSPTVIGTIALLAWVSSATAQITWQQSIAHPGPNPLVGEQSLALPDGGQITWLRDSALRWHAIRFDAEGSRVAGPIPGGDFYDDWFWHRDFAAGASGSASSDFGAVWTQGALPPGTPESGCAVIDGLPAPARARAFADGRQIEGRPVRGGAFDAAGGYYRVAGGELATQPRLLRFGIDCKAEDLGPLTAGAAAVATPDAVGVYVFEPFTGLRRVVDAVVEWEAPTLGVSSGLFALDAGDLVAAGRLSAGAMALGLSRIAPDGSLRWSHAIPWPLDPLAVFDDAGGAIVVLPGRRSVPPAGTDFSDVVLAINAQGQERWQASLGDRQFSGALRSDRAPGEVLLRAATVDGNEVVLRPGSTGLESLLSAGEGARFTAMLDDGRVAGGRDSEDGRELVRMDPADGSLEVLPADIGRGLLVTGLHLDAAGALVVVRDADVTLATPTEVQDEWLHAFAPDGSVRWAVQLPAAPAPTPGGFPGAQHWLTANAETVCIYRLPNPPSAPHLACFDRDDGATRFGWNVTGAPVHFAQTDTALELLASADCQSQTPPCVGTHLYLRLDAAGNTLSSQLLGSVLSQTQGGDALRAAASSGAQRFAVTDWDRGLDRSSLALHDADGVRLLDVSLDGRVDLLAVSDAGHMLALHDDRLVSFAPDGSTRWQSDAVDFDPQQRVVGARELGADDWLVVWDEASDSPFEARTRLLRLRASDGSSPWSDAVTLSQPASGVLPGLVVMNAEDRLLVRGELPLTVDLASGRIVDALSASDVAPGGGDTWLVQSASTTDGSALLFASSRADQGTVQVSMRDTTALLTRELDSVDGRLLGAWTLPEWERQGLYLDHDADIGAYGAWFTYTFEADVGNSALRWYTLVQEAAETAEGVADFTLYRNAGGVFGSGTTTAVAVGTARLTPLRCDRALFEFNLDDDAGGRSGRSVIERTAAASRDCVSGEPVAAARRGLDPRSSGAWYDSAASGQGLAFDLRPPTDTDPGLFAGGWFTFDAQDAPADPLGQHWFTLAGSLEDADAGAFTVPIYRSWGAGSRPGAGAIWQVGSATLHFTACDAATLEYSFIDDPLAHAFRGRSGVQNLRRIGGCGD